MTRFEELDCWVRARELAGEVYRVTGVGACAQDFALRNQMRRAAVSVMSNIAEGFERDGNKEFIQFLSIAKGSVGELKAQMYILLDAQYIDECTFATLYALATETGRLIGGFMRYLSQSPLDGIKRRSHPQVSADPDTRN